MEMREDAVLWNGRVFVPTSDATKWVENWDEFRKVGGGCCYSEDQTMIELRLPAPYKFSVKFGDSD